MKKIQKSSVWCYGFFLFVLFGFFFKRSMTMVVVFHKLPSFSTISFQPNFSQHTISCCVIKEIIMKKSDLIDFSYNVDLWCRWRYARSPRWVYTSRKVNLRRFFCLFFVFFFHQNSISITFFVTVILLFILIIQWLKLYSWLFSITNLKKKALVISKPTLRALSWFFNYFIYVYIYEDLCVVINHEIQAHENLV